MGDEDFQQELRDYFFLEAQRHRDIMGAFSALTQKVDKIMTSNQDVMDAITTLSTGLTQLKSSIDTAISDMGSGGDMARAGFVDAIKAAATQVGTIETELTTAIAALTPPPVTAPTPTAS